MTLNTRSGVVDNLLVKKIRFETVNSGIKWLTAHNTYILKSSGLSAVNINPTGNFSALADRPLVVGTDIDKVEYRIFSNSMMYIGVATINKNLNTIIDTGEFAAVSFSVIRNDTIVMRITTDRLEIIHGADVKYLSLVSLNGQTVYPMLATVANNTLSASIVSSDNLSIYSNDEGVPFFDTTKGLNKVQPIEFKTGGGLVTFDGSVTTGTITTIGIAGLIDDVTSSSTTSYSGNKIDTLINGVVSIDDAKSSTTTTYSSNKINTLIAGVNIINDNVSSTTTTYSSNKTDTLLTGIIFIPGASILSVAPGQSITTAATIQYTLTLAHVSLNGSLDTSLFSVNVGNVVVSNVVTDNLVFTFDAQFDAVDSAITLTYDNGIGASQMKNAALIAFPSAIANNTVEVTV